MYPRHSFKDSKEIVLPRGDFKSGLVSTCHLNTGADDYLITNYYPLQASQNLLIQSEQFFRGFSLFYVSNPYTLIYVSYLVEKKSQAPNSYALYMKQYLS